jgi:hypothetical protein
MDVLIVVQASGQEQDQRLAAQIKNAPLDNTLL